MNISFKKVTMHNFLSFGHAEIDLRERNYCLVKGINNCPLDNAVSNGSGKSTWISAICWALTGETVQGVTSGIKNIFVDEPSCWVKLDFDVDGIAYDVTRSKEPATSLKIIRDGKDISGKGIRESSLVLAQYLPDLNRDLLTSVVLLGQGLPNKFTDNTPSGRKETLERLSKSDFVIEGIKERIAKRQSALSESIRGCDDAVTRNDAEIAALTKSMISAQSRLDESSKTNYDGEIEQAEHSKAMLEKSLPLSEDNLATLESAQEICNATLLGLTKDKSAKLVRLNEEHSRVSSNLIGERSRLKAELSAIELSLSKISEHPDVCPTCGQRLPNAEHLLKERAEKEALVGGLLKSVSEIESGIAEQDARKRDKTAEVSDECDAAIAEAEVKASTLKAKISKERANVSGLRAHLTELTGRLAALKAKKESKERDEKSLGDEIESDAASIAFLQESNDKRAKEKEELLRRAEVVKKMDTLVKRDFRGFLLSGIIEFIEAQAKEYCKDIFGTDELSFRLDGNNIDVEYCSKDFSSLSGGEKQRVDLIIQFAIRRMMSQYLDFNSNILCLDEIFDNLDERATANVIGLISNRLTDIESVFIISHHADELSIPCDSTITIIKDASGVSRAE
jgi:DNA repair exonuclease SbcCD ATPase subunit